MKLRSSRILMVLGGVLVGLSGSQLCHAVLVDSGWDLFTTVPTTSFNGMNWQGVPLGTYNFGGSIGSQNVYGTDTIMQRVNAVPDGGGSTALNLVALQLESINAPSLYLTLQSVHGGPASTGQATINADGTFTSFFDVWFDVRIGGLDGPIYQSGDLKLVTSGTWNHVAPAGALTIEGVNYELNGVGPSADFWTGALSHINPDDPNHPHHDTEPAIPEPSTYVAGVLLLLPFGASTLRILRKNRTA